MTPSLIPSRSHIDRLSRAAIALVTSASFVFQSVAPAFAQALTVAPGSGHGTEITQAANGVPVVDIAGPNAGGLSQNVFPDFNVGSSGLVLNNSTELGQSVLGGVVLGNGNLGGTPARVILNEVTSTNPSTLGGAMEVFGSRAAVVLANPNGITCDGCGFINAPRATLTTGTPVLTGDQLTGFDVTGGTVTIGAGGADARSTDYFDIVSRAVVLNGAVHGQDVGVFAGQNDFDYAARQITAVRPSDGSPAPAVAIDSSALGGMYANRIRLESTEAGVGVNAPAGLVAGMGGMRISADGNLVVGSASSRGAIRATSHSDAVRMTGVVHAGGGLGVLAGGGIDLDGSVVGAFGDIALGGTAISLSDAAVIAGIDASGKTRDGVNSIALTADGAVTIDADSTIFAGDTVTVRAGTIAHDGQTVAGGDIDMSARSGFAGGDGQTLSAGGNAALRAGGAIFLDGTVRADAGLAIAGGTIESSANLSANALTLSSDGQMTLGGVSLAGSRLSIESGDTLTLAGTARAGEAATLAAQSVRLAQDARLSAQGAVTVEAQGRLDFDTGALVAAGIASDGTVGTEGALRLAGATIAARDARLIAAGDVTLAAADALVLHGGAATAGARLDIAAGDMTSSAALSSVGNLAIAADSIDTSGAIETAGGLSLSSRAALGQSGAVRANGNLTIDAGSTLGQSGTIEALGDIALSSGAAFAQSGTVRGNGNIALDAGGGLTQSGDIDALGDLSLSSGSAVIQSGTVHTNGAATIDAGGALTQSGTMEALGRLSLSSGAALNQSGTLRANGDIALDAGDALGQSGTIEGGASIALSARGGMTNAAGARVVSGANLDVSAARLINDGALGAGRDLGLSISGDIGNTDLLAAKRHIDIALDGTLANTGTIFAAHDLDIAGLAHARAAAVINENALIEANQGSLSIAAQSLINRTTGIGFETDHENNIEKETVNGGCLHSAFGKKGCDETTTTTQTETWTDSATGAVNVARILSGGNMALSGGAIENTYSLIAANGNLALSGTSLTNTARDLIAVETVTTDVTKLRWECQRFLGICHNLRPIVTEEPTAVTTATATIGSVHATIQAGGTLSGNFTGRIDNTTIRESGGQVGLSSGVGVAGPSAVSGIGAGATAATGTGPTAATVNLSTGAGGTNSVPGAPVIDLTTVLGGSSLTQTTPDPQSPYLVETRPEFIDVSNFYNSDSFFSAMPDYRPGTFRKRLGDAYVETRLIQDQIFALTGRRLLEGFGADTAQIAALYENALSVAAELNLSTGVTLSADQVAALTNDIVWPEWQEVDGQRVLVPRVYLASGSRNARGGATLTGDNVVLASSSLSNGGVIASAGLTGLVVADGLDNIGGLISGKRIDLEVGGTLANLSGEIAGTNVTIDAGALVNQTLVTRDEHAEGFADRAHAQAQITALGDLDIGVAGDVAVLGGRMEAGDALALAAGGDVTIKANRLEKSSATTFDGGSASSYALTHQLASLRAGGDLAVTSGGDMALEGAAVTAGGDAALTTGGDLTVASVQDVAQSQMEASFGSAGLLSTRIDISEQAQSVTSVGGTIAAGGNVALTSETGDLTLRAASVDAGGGIALSAQEGQISLLSATDSDYARQTHNTEDLLWWTASDEGHALEEVVHTALSLGEGLTFTTRDGVVVDYHETGTLESSIAQLSNVEGLSWMADLQGREDVDWNSVSAAQEAWDYHDQGLTEVGAALVALAVGAATGGTGGLASGFANSAAGAIGLSGNAIATAALFNPPPPPS